MYVYKGIKLAIVEAKKYAQKLQLETSYSTYGKEIYQISMKTGDESLVTDFFNNPPNQYEFLDQKRKRKVLEMQKLITNFNIKPDGSVLHYADYLVVIKMLVRSKSNDCQKLKLR